MLTLLVTFLPIKPYIRHWLVPRPFGLHFWLPYAPVASQFLSPTCHLCLSHTPWRGSASNGTCVTTSPVPPQALLSAFETAHIWEAGWEGRLGSQNRREDGPYCTPSAGAGCARAQGACRWAPIPTACKESCQGQLCQELAEIARSACSSATCH